MSYELGDFCIDLSTAAVTVICCLLVLPYKKNKLGVLPQAITLILVYVAIDLTVRIFPEGTLENDLSFMVCCIMEVLALLGCVWLGTTGNMWKNYFVLLIFSMIASAVTYVISMIVPAMAEAVNMNCVGEPGVNLLAAFGFLMSAIVVSVAISFPLRLIFKKNSNKQGKIYKIIGIVYTIYALWNTLYKRSLVIQLHLKNGTLTSFDLNLISIIAVVFLVVGLNFMGYSFNKMEQKRLLKEKAQLKAVMDQKLEQYQNVMTDNYELFKMRDEFVQNIKDNETETNKEYISEIVGLSEHTINQSFVGSALLDSVLNINRRKMQEKAIAFEAHFDIKAVEDLKQYMDESEMAIIIDGLLQLATLCVNQAHDDKYIVVTERKESGPLVMRFDFTKPDKMSLTQRKMWEPSFMKRIGMDIESKEKYLLAYRVLEMNSVAVKVKNEEDKTSIILFVEKDN